MASACHTLLLALSCLVFIHKIKSQGCPSSIHFNCPDHAYDTGNTSLAFPFTNTSLPNCGHCVLRCNAYNHTEINCRGTIDANYVLALDIIPSNRTIVAAFPNELDLDAIRKAICIDPNDDSTTQSLSLTYVDGFETYVRCPYQTGSSKWDSQHYEFCGDGNNLYGPYENGQLPENRTLPQECSSIKIPNTSTKDRKFSAQYTFSDQCQRCVSHGGRCQDGSNGKVDCDQAKKGKRTLEAVLFSAFSGLAVIILVLIIYLQRRRIKGSSTLPSTNKFIKDNRNFETVLKNYASLTPKRYAYSDIKKMTNSFMEKLGEGGFGGVYKGKLLDGRLVAVKLLKNSEGDGEGFINEVVSIGRTNHVNVVALLGFCFEGHKRALIYEYMANGSLEKFRHVGASNGHSPLPLETLFTIVLGIARGLEYLHRGCKTRILHFDIKPHNILLDEKFCPKISDFGFAKLTPHENQSKISMSGARGTIGYIAPEVFCRNFGDVSHKSDVYSYGMLVLEMIGSRTKANSQVESSSDCYFPQWIYKQLEHGEEADIEITMNDNDKQLKRKMIVVSLWCIQVVPSSRPSMSRVVQMLEGSMESIDIPPMPSFSSPPRLQWEPSTSSTMTK